MIDYEATLQKFFNEVIKWLVKASKKAKDVHQLNQIEKEIADVRRIAADPKQYAFNTLNKKGAPLWDFLDSKMDPTVYQKYTNVLWSLNDLYGNYDYPRETAQTALLMALKVVKYKNSSNIFKDFTYNFTSPSHYAVKAKIENQK